MLGHRLGLRSWLNLGTVFWLEVPLGDPAAVKLQIPEAIALTSGVVGRSVWYVDDDPAALDAALVLLERWGCEVKGFSSIPEALAGAVAGQPPHVLLLDHRLGNERGFDLVPQLEAIWQAQTPVIMLTADREPELLQKIAEREWILLHKPVKPSALRAALSQRIAQKK